MKHKLIKSISTLIVTILPLTTILAQTSVTSSKGVKASPMAKVYQFINGQWFDGMNFQKRTFYSKKGVLTSATPKKIDETIDLAGGYIVPPFGEAHNHNLEGSYNFADISRKYLEEGIFYYKNPNSILRLRPQIADKINIPSSLDAVFAGGGLTATGGHPTVLYDERLNKFLYTFLKLQNLENEGYFIINNQNDLDAKWQKILDGKPDFIKTYLLYSEEFDLRRDDSKYNGHRGLDPKILPAIVERAHRAGLRVSTHIETATDFHNALVAGVDEINHLPGYFIPSLERVPSFVISDDDARLAAERNVFVVTTTDLSLGLPTSPYVKVSSELFKAIQENQKRNLALLKKYKVRVAVGSDDYSKTALDEAMCLYDLHVYTNLELLKMWTQTTAQTIFPKRKIGFLKPGYEASFLVLEVNPISDFQAVKKIKMRFKQGYIMQNFDK